MRPRCCRAEVFLQNLALSVALVTSSRRNCEIGYISSELKTYENYDFDRLHFVDGWLCRSCRHAARHLRRQSASAYGNPDPPRGLATRCRGDKAAGEPEGGSRSRTGQQTRPIARCPD